MIYIENLSTRDMDSVTWNDLIIELILLETMEGLKFVREDAGFGME